LSSCHLSLVTRKMGQLLEKLFESVPKIKILRTFLRNPEENFTFSELQKRTQVKSQALKSELTKLNNIDLIQDKIVTRKEELTVRKKVKIKKYKAKVFYVNPEFRLLTELRNLIARDSITSHKKIAQEIRSLGNVKLAVISGIFLDSERSRTDLLVVGDNIKRQRFERFLSQVESEIGRTLQYTIMNSKEFEYRRDMYDRFLRDILEYPHQKLINKLEI